MRLMSLEQKNVLGYEKKAKNYKTCLIRCEQDGPEVGFSHREMDRSQLLNICTEDDGDILRDILKDTFFL